MSGAVEGATLLPCPFCGAQAQWVEDNGDLDTPFGLVTEHAEMCFLSRRMMADWETIITAWNTRLASASAPAELLQATAYLRTLCNAQIKAATNNAYRPRPGEQVINPPVPFVRVNDILKACDAVFRVVDGLTAAPQPPVVEQEPIPEYDADDISHLEGLASYLDGYSRDKRRAGLPDSAKLFAMIARHLRTYDATRVSLATKPTTLSTHLQTLRLDLNDVARSQDYIDGAQDMLDKVAGLRITQPAEERMREALEPFAREADAQEHVTSFSSGDSVIPRTKITIGQLRRARAALKEPRDDR